MSYDSQETETSYFEAIRLEDEKGNEYWSARSLYRLLGYSRWEKFQKPIEQAKKACENSGQDTSVHFHFVVEIVKRGATKKLRDDYHLSWYACLLIVHMTDERHFSHPQHIAIQLEIVPEDWDGLDAELIFAVSEDTTEVLRNDGYTVQPIYTPHYGVGGSFPEIVTILTTIATDAWAQRDIILADTSALVTILGAVIPIARHLLKAHEKQVPIYNMQKTSIKITTEIDGVPISIEAPDLESADAAINLAKRFQADHPNVAARVTPHSKVKVKSHISKNRPRRRR